MKNPTEIACYLEGLEYGRDRLQEQEDLITEALKDYSPFGEYSRGIIEGYKRGMRYSHFALMCLVEKIKKAKEELESSFEELASSDLGGEA